MSMMTTGNLSQIKILVVESSHTCVPTLLSNFSTIVGSTLFKVHGPLDTAII